MAPTTAGVGPMIADGTMVSTVNRNRNGMRRPSRSESAPRSGETRALMPTLTAIVMPRTSWPRPGPNRSSEVSHRPMAVDTTAYEKIVFAKS